MLVFKICKINMFYMLQQNIWIWLSENHNFLNSNGSKIKTSNINKIYIESSIWNKKISTVFSTYKIWISWGLPLWCTLIYIIIL